jgi:hypothetical protein
MRARNLIVAVVMGGLTLPMLASAEDIFWSETDFDPGTWAAPTPFLAAPASPGLDYDVATDRFQSGNSFMVHQFSFDVPAGEFHSAFAPVFMSDWTHDPASDGAIISVSGAVRTFPIAVQPPQGGGFGVMRMWLEQDGKYFVLSAQSPNFPTNYPEFAGHNVYSAPDMFRNVNGAIATDFIEIVPDVGFDFGSQPDFAGSPISFGYGYSMTTTDIAGDGGMTLAAAFDDASVRLSVVPEPTTALLLALSALGLLRRRSA